MDTIIQREVKQHNYQSNCFQRIFKPKNNISAHWRSKGGAEGAVRPGRHLLGGGFFGPYIIDIMLIRRL